MPGRIQRAVRLVGHLCRLGLAFIFLSAGLIKALDPEGFTQEVGQYGLITGWAARAFAQALIPLEVAVGAALLLNYRNLLSLGLAAGLIAMFIGAISYALITDQPLQACGCFGRNTPRTPQETLREDLGFLAAALAGLGALGWTGRWMKVERAAGGAAPARVRWKGAVLGATALASGAFAAASPHLPIDDLATALRPGVRWEDLGVALAEVDLRRGSHLVAILGVGEEASLQAVEALNGLAAAGDPPVTALSSDEEDAIFEFRFTRGPSFPVHHVAVTDLRRMHRRLPRFFAVRDGLVRATWDGPPRPAELAAALR